MNLSKIYIPESFESKLVVGLEVIGNTLLDIMSDVRTFDPEVEQRLSQLSDKFNNFITRQKTEIIKSKEDYTNRLTQLKNEHKEILKALQNLAQRETELRKITEREVQDSNVSQERLNELKMKEKTLGEERLKLEQSVMNLQEKVNKRKEELNTLKLNQEKQAEINLPETMIYEQLLGFKIEGMKDDVLKFVFKNIDSNDPEKLFIIILDVSEHLYKVNETNPSIPNIELNEILNNFNESRDLTKFLKNIRIAFKKLT